MKAFIHISDLHIAELNKPGILSKNERTKETWLNAQEDKDNDDYIGAFCKSVRGQFPEKECDFYLLVSGDIADSSSEIEYRFAKEFLEQIQRELKIDKNNILIVPGNHDVYRPKCRDAADKEPQKPAYLHFEAKYINFKSFFDSFFSEVGKTFDVNNQIVDFLPIDDEKLLFVGINTNYKIDYQGGSGAVEINRFKQEIIELCDKYTCYSKIAVFHHNIRSDSDEDNTPYGSWEKTDWIRFKNVLEEKGFKMIMFGNEHTRTSSRNLNTHRGENEMYQSDSGSFALHNDTCTPSYKVYELLQDMTKVVLKQHIFELHDRGQTGIYEYGRWCRLINKDHDELDEYVLQENISDPFGQVVNDDFSSEINNLSVDPADLLKSESKEDGANAMEANLEYLANTVFQEEMMSIIKKEHLYHPGHFHWGKSSRSHNWIDTISLLNNKQYIHLIQKEVLRVVMDVKKAKAIEFDAIIGLGMEGNVMSTQLLLDDAPYTFLPYTYRYDDFYEFEKNICLDNDTGKYKIVLIITDVVNKGRMLKSLIEEKDPAFFSRVEQIHIVSLFYTGKYEDRGIPDGLKEIKDKTIGFYSLMQLEVGECPYDDAFKEKCVIYKEHLCDVYEFYSEK